MDNHHIIPVTYSGSGSYRTRAVYQYDYGQILSFDGFDLPDAFEVHFHTGGGESVTVIGHDDQVAIPDSLLQIQRTVTVWLFLHDTEDDGETRFVVEIPVRGRSAITDEEPTPEEQSVITQAIAALQTAVTKTEAAQDAAETAADEAESAADSLKGATAGAVTLPEGSAATAELSVNEGVFAFNFGIPIGATGPQGPQGIKGDRGEKGETGATPDMSIGTVQTLPAGSQATAQISGTAEQPVLSLGIPKGDPGSVPIDDTAGAGDTTKVWSADKTAGEVSDLKSAIDTLEPKVDSLEINKADVIVNTASGAIASFSDGADDLPIKELTVGIEPVQDLHGYDSPWPAGGGKNLIDASLYNLPKTITSQTTIVNYETSEQTTWTVAAKVTNNSDIVGRVNIILYNEGAVVRQTYTSIPVGATNAVISATVDGSSYTFTKISIAISGNASGYSITVSDIQISKGDAVSVISPYSNICPISGWTGCEVNISGRNLIRSNAEWDNFKCRPSNGILIGSQYSVIVVPVPKGIIRIHQGHVSGSYINYVCLADKMPEEGDTIYEEASKSGWTNYTVDNSAGHPYLLVIGPSVTPTLTPAEWSVANENYVMLDNEYDANGNYEPKPGTTIPISWQSEAGTVYGGKLTVNDDGTGTLVVDRAEMVITGEESSIKEYRVSPTNYGHYYCSIEFRTFPVTPIKAWNFVSNMLVQTTASFVAMGVGSGRFQTNNLNFTLCVAGPTTAEEYEAWVKQQATDGHPLTIVHELNSPITYTLSASQVQTILGVNNIWADTGDVAVEYRVDTKTYVDSKEPDVPVQDVQVNGVSVLQDGVANVPLAGINTLGVVALSNSYGIKTYGNANALGIIKATDKETQTGTDNYDSIVSSNQHLAAFYGLAKAAGADMRSVAYTTVGQYPEAQKSAIHEMLSGSVSVSGTTPTINALPGVRYVCGEVTTLDVTVPASGIIDVVFTSGSTPTVLTVTPPTGMTVKWANGFDPTSLDANTTYEINIADGLGVAVGWT